MTGLEVAVAVASLTTAGIGIPGAIYAVITARRSIKEQDVKALVVAIIADETFKTQTADEVALKWNSFLRDLEGRFRSFLAEAKEEAREAGKIAAADRAQSILNTQDFMPRREQENTNREVSRRLSEVERKIDNIPEKTAEQVMLRLRPTT